MGHIHGSFCHFFAAWYCCMKFNKRYDIPFSFLKFDIGWQLSSVQLHNDNSHRGSLIGITKKAHTANTFLWSQEKWILWKTACHDVPSHHISPDDSQCGCIFLEVSMAVGVAISQLCGLWSGQRVHRAVSAFTCSHRTCSHLHYSTRVKKKKKNTQNWNTADFTIKVWRRWISL